MLVYQPLVPSIFQLDLTSWEVCTLVYQPLVLSIFQLNLMLQGLYVSVPTSCTEYLQTGSVCWCTNLLYRVSSDWVGTLMYQPLVPSIFQLDLTLQSLYISVPTFCTESIPSGYYALQGLYIGEPTSCSKYLVPT